MKRDMELVRSLLLVLEGHSAAELPNVPDVKGFTEEAVVEHVRLLVEAGMIDAIDASTISEIDYIQLRLTWHGHDFVSSIRDPEIWPKNQSGVEVRWRLEHRAHSRARQRFRSAEGRRTRAAGGVKNDEHGQHGDAFLYAGLSHVEIEVANYGLGNGISISQAYAHLTAPHLMAFARPLQGQPHPAPWRAAKGGLATILKRNLRYRWLHTSPVSVARKMLHG